VRLRVSAVIPYLFRVVDFWVRSIKSLILLRIEAGGIPLLVLMTTQFVTGTVICYLMI
jgi:hypothetical protein